MKRMKDEGGRMNQTGSLRVCRVAPRVVLFVLFILHPSSFILSAPQDAVVLQKTHGVSCTVIATGPGRTYLLGCAHGYEGAADARKPITLDTPAPTPGPPTQVGIQLVALDAGADLSLLVLNAGPLPYCCPVAPAGFRPGPHLLSVGYDEMRQPATVRPAHIVGGQGTETWTRERPWHGRSGGALLDADSGYLIGVCSGYTGRPDHQEVERGTWGIYSSADSIRRFLTARGYGSLIGVTPAVPQIVGSPGAADVVARAQQLSQQIAALRAELEQLQATTGPVLTAPLTVPAPWSPAPAVREMREPFSDGPCPGGVCPIAPLGGAVPPCRH